MSNARSPAPAKAVAVPRKSSGQRLLAWVEEPLGQIITASVATIGSFGVVLSGIWFVNVLVS